MKEKLQEELRESSENERKRIEEEYWQKAEIQRYLSSFFTVFSCIKLSIGVEMTLRKRSVLVLNADFRMEFEKVQKDLDEVKNLYVCVCDEKRQLEAELRLQVREDRDREIEEVSRTNK